MRVLILGGDGMLGHQLLLSLGPRHDVRVTLRQERDAYAGQALFAQHETYFGVDARDDTRLLEVVGDFMPQAIVNCVGIVKQRAQAKSSSSGPIGCVAGDVVSSITPASSSRR